MKSWFALGIAWIASASVAGAIDLLGIPNASPTGSTTSTSVTTAATGTVEGDLRDHPSYDDLDRFFRTRSRPGAGFFETMQRDGLPVHLRTEAAFRAVFPRAVTDLRLGEFGGPIALYSVYAEESRLVPRANEANSLQLSGTFAGMNAPHDRVAQLMTEMLRGVTVDQQSIAHGTGHLRLPVDGRDQPADISVNYDTGVISPPIYLSGGPRRLTIDDVRTFLDAYLKPQGDRAALMRRGTGETFEVNSSWVDPRGITVFLGRQPSTEQVAHETRHALFHCDSMYRDYVLNQVRSSNQEQREAAVLYAATSYDVLSGRTPRSPMIVIDESFNAYRAGGTYYAETMITKVGNMCSALQAKGLRLDLPGNYQRFDDLPLSAEEREEFRSAFAAFNKRADDVLRNEPDRILPQIRNFGSLLRIIQRCDPTFYGRVELARRQYIEQRI